MKRDVNDFLEEITSNFSELFVETFLLRYLSEFDKNDLLDVVPRLNCFLRKKVNKKLESALINMGYDKNKIEKLLK